MATSLTLRRVADAPILNSFVGHVEALLQLLLAELGNGSAPALSISSLDSVGPGPLGTGELQSTYHAKQEQADQYRKDLNSLDAKIVGLAAKSAEVTDTAYGQVTKLVGEIEGILRDDVPEKPSISQQLNAMDRIAAAAGTAANTVSTARQQLSAHGDEVAASSPSPAAYTSPTKPGGARNSPSRSTETTTRKSHPVNAQPIAAGKKAQVSEIYEYLIKKCGFSPAQAAGILGNMQVESGFNTAAFNLNEGAIGLCQWEGFRRDQLEQFAAAHGKPVTDWQVQVDYMMRELQGGESNAYAHLKAAQTPEAAASVFDRYYERSSHESIDQRIDAADKIYKSRRPISV